ncbi:DinB family protein [Pseudovibrio axinellae]|uniref:DinB family protein n=1 Tax=Pseudovibrio axinellae TaxID=989403 RepID=UPI0009ED09D6
MFHFFNHQTHHRGQIHAMLTQLSRSPAALDKIYFQLETSHWMTYAITSRAVRLTS